MKHILVFVMLALGIGYLALRKSDLDTLMIHTANYTESQTGNRFVDVDPAAFPVTPKYLAESGVITVVYFHDETCHGCAMLDRQLKDFLPLRPDVAVRKVHISVGKDAYSEAIRNYRWKIYMAPCVLIFGKNGKLIAADKGTDGAGQELLEEWIAEELQKAARIKG